MIKEIGWSNFGFQSYDMELKTGITYSTPNKEKCIEFITLGSDTNGELMEVRVKTCSNSKRASRSKKYIHPVSSLIINVVEGSLSVTKQNQLFSLEEGESIEISPNTSYYYQITGDSSNVIDIAFSPAMDYDLFFANYFATKELDPNIFKKQVDRNCFLALLHHHFPNHVYLSESSLFLQKIKFDIFYLIGKLTKKYEFIKLPFS